MKSLKKALCGSVNLTDPDFPTTTTKKMEKKKYIYIYIYIYGIEAVSKLGFQIGTNNLWQF